MTQLVVTDTGTFRVVPGRAVAHRRPGAGPARRRVRDRTPPARGVRPLTVRRSGCARHPRDPRPHRPAGARARPHPSAPSTHSSTPSDPPDARRAARPDQDSGRLSAPLPGGAPAEALPTTIALAGRVTASAFPHGPVVGASITPSGTPTAPVVAVGVPLASAHPAGTTVRLRPLPAVPTTELDGGRPSRRRHRRRWRPPPGSAPEPSCGWRPESTPSWTPSPAPWPCCGARCAPHPPTAAVAIVTPGAPGAATTLTRDAPWPGTPSGPSPPRSRGVRRGRGRRRHRVPHPRPGHRPGRPLAPARRPRRRRPSPHRLGRQISPTAPSTPLAHQPVRHRRRPTDLTRERSRHARVLAPGVRGGGSLRAAAHRRRRHHHDRHDRADQARARPPAPRPWSLTIPSSFSAFGVRLDFGSVYADQRPTCRTR